MWFRNLQFYRLPKNWAAEASMFERHLSNFTLQPCSSSAMQSLGWVAPRAGGALVHAVNRQWLIALGAEQRLLPASVVKQFADDKAKDIEENEGRKVGRKEMRELREAMSIELMPRAFVRRHTTFCWIDPVNGWLVVDSASPARAEELLEHLRKSVDGLPVKLVKVTQSPSSAMTGWVAGGEAPKTFTLDQDLFLRSAEKAEVRYVHHTLEGEDVRQHIAAGKVVTRLAMTWGERISFVLTENLEVKRLSFLDILKDQADGQAENEDERFDIDFTLMTGEVSRLLDDLVLALGGEQVSAEAEQAVAAADKLNDLALEDGATVTVEHAGKVVAEFGETDPLFDKAKQIVVENRRASISLVQRHLQIGYNRAARLIEDMEKAGIVSSMDKSGNRKVLASA